MIFGKKKCTTETDGTVIRLYDKGNDFPFMMQVMYVVNGKTYYIEESVKLINEKINRGFFLIGQRKVPATDEHCQDSCCSTESS